jgi:hypothetical protein
LIPGPLIGWLIIWAAFKYKTNTPVERAMLFSIIGFYSLFFVSSFFTRTEANWTIPIIVPIIYLSYHYLKNDHQKARWIYKLLPFSLIISIVLKTYMFLDISQIKFVPKDEFHQNKSWAAEIKKQADGSPVIFTNSYQRASKYWFYSGDTSFSLNTYKYRRSGYNFWPLEKQFQHKTVFLVGSKHSDNMPGYIETPRAGHAFIKIDLFQSYSQLNITSLLPLVVKNDLINYHLKISYPTAGSESTYSKNTKIILILYPTDKSTPVLVNTDLVIDGRNQVFKGVLRLPHLDHAKYIVRWGISNSFAEPTINSRAYKLINLNVSR